MKRVLYLVVFLIVMSILAILVVEHLIPQKHGNPLHLIGGFSADTPEQAANAAADGIQVAFEYGQPSSEKSRLGQEIETLHMKEVDGYISSYLYYYECHRTKELKPSLLGPHQYCQEDEDPSLTDENALLTTIATHLKEVKNNPLIIGYWVLDDWVQWDTGSARPILSKIHQLIQQYTPGRPAICGFGGSIGLYQEYGWGDWIADNFSPQGCDEVGFYIYTSSLPDTTPAVSPDAYNWSMQGVLPAMFTSLQKRGWDITKEPLIGIGQAFGGPIKNTDRYWVMPNAYDIELQSRSFCEHGATGLTFYAWDDSGFGSTTQTPMNNKDIEDGIRRGIAACEKN